LREREAGGEISTTAPFAHEVETYSGRERSDPTIQFGAPLSAPPAKLNRVSNIHAPPPELGVSRNTLPQPNCPQADEPPAANPYSSPSRKTSGEYTASRLPSAPPVKK